MKLVLVLVLNRDLVTIKRMLAPKGIRIPGLHSYVRDYNLTQENVKNYRDWRPKNLL